MKYLLLLLLFIGLSGCTPAEVNMVLRSVNDGLNAAHHPQQECNPRSWTMVIDGEYRYCHKDYYCNVSCM